MKILFVGDIVADLGVTHALDRIMELRSSLRLDLVIANAENSASNGLGMSPRVLEMLRPHVDVFTGGNHSWDHPEATTVLSDPRVLRPANMEPGTPGNGTVQLQIADELVSVLNVIDADAMSPSSGSPKVTATPYQAFIAADLQGTVIVDYHGNDVYGKQTFAHAVDGRVAAVLGTHTHEPTLRLHRLPRGTALVTEVGMTGAQGGVMGFCPEQWITGIQQGKSLHDLPIPLPVTGPCTLSAVLLETENGLTRTVKRVA
jgi:2',3'-cyclic-nucleotide 2'-phosphodiesterase